MTTTSDFATPVSTLFAAAGDRLRAERSLQLENERNALEAQNVYLRGRVEELEKENRGLRAAVEACVDSLDQTTKQRKGKVFDLTTRGSGV